MALAVQVCNVSDARKFDFDAWEQFLQQDEQRREQQRKEQEENRTEQERVNAIAKARQVQLTAAAQLARRKMRFTGRSPVFTGSPP